MERRDQPGIEEPSPPQPEEPYQDEPSIVPLRKKKKSKKSVVVKEPPPPSPPPAENTPLEEPWGTLGTTLSKKSKKKKKGALVDEAAPPPPESAPKWEPVSEAELVSKPVPGTEPTLQQNEEGGWGLGSIWDDGGKKKKESDLSWDEPSAAHSEPTQKSMEAAPNEVFADPEPDPGRRGPTASPYTEFPASILIGPNKVAHFVPEHLLQSLTPRLSAFGHINIPEVDLDTGHTLVHYLYTGKYQSLGIDTNDKSIDPSMGFKRALLVYIMSNTYGLPSLECLAKSEIQNYGSEISISEVLHATGENFKQLGSDSWFHHYLHEKSKEALEGDDENHFFSDTFLDSMNNLDLSRFMMKCVASLYKDKITKLRKQSEEVDQAKKKCEPETEAWSTMKRNSISDQNSLKSAPEPYSVEHSASETCTLSTEGYCTVEMAADSAAEEIAENAMEDSSQCEGIPESATAKYEECEPAAVAEPEPEPEPEPVQDLFLGLNKKQKKILMVKMKRQKQLDDAARAEAENECIESEAVQAVPITEIENGHLSSVEEKTATAAATIENQVSLLLGRLLSNLREQT